MKKLTLLAIGCQLLAIGSVKAQTGIISTVAGTTGLGGYNGDGIPATSAKLNNLEGVALDAAGNIYIADQVNNLIRKVNTSGIISTIAGIPRNAGYSGDGGQATSAEITNPNGVRVDAAGNVYFSDGGNAVVREVLTTGIIHTIAGNGFGGYNGNGGPATSAELNYPVGLAIDNTNNLLYIADQVNNVIRRVNLGTKIITTVAGNHNMGFSGNGGPATSAMLNTPIGVAVDASGNFYIADQMNNEIRKVNAAGTITAFAGTGVGGYNVSSGPATSTDIYNPLGVWADASGNVYLTDPGDGYIREVLPSGMMYVIAGNASSGFSGDGGAAVNASMDYPFDVVTDASHNVYIADLNNNRVRKITATCSVDSTSGIIYNYPGCANSNDGIAVAVSNSPFAPYTFSWSNGSTKDSLTGLSAGTYTVNITDALGCSATGTIALTSPPALVVTAGSYTVCAGQDVKMSSSASGGSGPYIYTWFNGWPDDTLTVNATATTQYTIYVADQNGCTDSAVVNIMVNSLPSVSLYPDNYTVCLASTVDGLHGSPAGGTYSGTGVTGSNFDGNSAGLGNDTVTYTYTDGNNCTNSIQIAVTVTVCTGIQSIPDDGQISIYPNPANDVVNVMLSNDYLNSTIGLYSVTGEQLYKTANPERKQQVEIPVSQLSAGVYLLKVTQTDGATLMRKVEVTK